jgi:transposase
MAMMSTIEEEDAERPRRERENLVGERTRTINRVKSTLVRLGIRDCSRRCVRRHGVQQMAQPT